MNTNIDEHLDEVLGVINMPKKEITKVEAEEILKSEHDHSHDHKHDDSHEHKNEKQTF